MVRKNNNALDSKLDCRLCGWNA